MKIKLIMGRESFGFQDYGTSKFVCLIIILYYINLYKGVS